MSVADWLIYANRGATRPQPLSPSLVEALSYIPEMGLQMEVFSGGQPTAGNGPRVGSTRHDHGNAADVFFRRGDERLDWANPQHRPVFEQIVSRGRQNGVTGFGAGDGYMQPGSMHIGFGNEAVWGAGGSSANAPDWLRNAFNGTAAGRPPAAPQETANGNTLSFPSSVTPEAPASALAGMFSPTLTQAPLDPMLPAMGETQTRRAEMAQREEQEKRRADQERRTSLADLIRY